MRIVLQLQQWSSGFAGPAIPASSRTTGGTPFARRRLTDGCLSRRGPKQDVGQGSLATPPIITIQKRRRSFSSSILGLLSGGADTYLDSTRSVMVLDFHLPLDRLG